MRLAPADIAAAGRRRPGLSVRTSRRSLVFRSVTTISTDHVDLISRKGFDDTVRELAAALGKASTYELMDRLASAADWDDYLAQCVALAGHSEKMIEVGQVNWGAVLTLSGSAMKARCFILGDPVTAQRLLAVGGAAVGLYLPTKILVFEGPDGQVHVAYDRLPLMAPSGNDALSAAAATIDTILEGLAHAAAS
jgi:hypothetical protein